MPDITMCQGYDCDRKHRCQRYTATPDRHRQSWFMSRPCSDRHELMMPTMYNGNEEVYQKDVDSTTDGSTNTP